MSIKTPNYVLVSELIVSIDFRSSKVLPEGSFVRPIDPRWIPKHIAEMYPGFDKVNQVFAYTHYGIVVIPKTLMRQT